MPHHFHFTAPDDSEFGVESSAPWAEPDGSSGRAKISLTLGDMEKKKREGAEMIVSMDIEAAARLHAALGEKLAAARAGKYDKQHRDTIEFLEEWLEDERRSRAEAAEKG